MITRIIRIGNSQGVRIPRPLLLQAGLEGEVEIESRKGALVVRAARRPRQGWDGAFSQAAEDADPVVKEWTDTPLNTWDDEEWQW